MSAAGPAVCRAHVKAQAGHHYGWGTPEYYAAMSDADALIKQVVDAYTIAGVRNDTLIMVVADHGGSGTAHGHPDASDLLIPWVASGGMNVGVRQGYEISSYTRNMDISRALCAQHHSEEEAVPNKAQQQYCGPLARPPRLIGWAR